MDSPPETKTARSGSFLLWIPLGLVLYFLSIGPVLKYFWFADVVLRIVYYPFFVCYKNAFLGELIDAYLDLWGVK